MKWPRTINDQRPTEAINVLDAQLTEEPDNLNDVRR